MGNLSHTVGGTDNLVSFKSAARVPIDSLKVHFKPIQEGEGDPSPENVRPIRGWNEVEAYRSGKNIARVTGYNAVNSSNADDHTDASNKYGTAISTNNYNLPDGPVIVTQTQAPNEANPSSYANGYFAVMVKNLIYGCYYDVSFKITNITNNILNTTLDSIRLLTPVGSYGNRHPTIINDNILIFKNIQWQRYSEDPTNSSYNRSNFEIRNGGMSFTLSEFMVTPAGMNDGVFEPYCGEVIPVTFPTEVGTIYGGYVDLAKGEVVAEWVKFTKKLSDCTSKTEYDDIIFYDFQPLSSLLCLASPDDGTISRNNSKCSIAPHRWSMQSSTINHYYIYRLNDDSTRLLLYLMPSSVESEDMEFELAFCLKDPIHYPLTSTQLKTFLNNNTFWSNTNDVTEVSYAIHDTAPIRAVKKRIMAASPHLEAASGDLINFNTDVAAPLKECKIYFEPMQEGEGDPSPENIRPIKGWTSVDVYLSSTDYEAPNNSVIPITFPSAINMLDSVTITANKTLSTDGIESNENGMSVTDFIKVSQGDIYTLTFTSKEAGRTRRIYGYDANKEPIEQLTSASWVNVGTTRSLQATIPSGVEYIRVCYKTADENIFLEGPESSTFYGGYVDLVNGKLIQEWIQVKIDFLSWTYMNSGECFRSTVPMERRGRKEISPVRSSIYETLEVDWTISSWADKEDYSISEHIGNSGDKLIQSIHIKDSRYTTVNDFLNGVGNEDIVYKLLTPIEYDIDPQTLKALRGTNNIWSNSNGPISIKYWKH